MPRSHCSRFPFLRSAAPPDGHRWQPRGFLISLTLPPSPLLAFLSFSSAATAVSSCSSSDGHQPLGPSRGELSMSRSGVNRKCTCCSRRRAWLSDSARSSSSATSPATRRLHARARDLRKLAGRCAEAERGRASRARGLLIGTLAVETRSDCGHPCIS